MKKHILLIAVCCFLTQTSEAQINLVPNPSFEDTVACPTFLTQIDRATGWMSFSYTPDYFNACASSNVPVSVSVPHNIWGDQTAYTGNAYAGFAAYSVGSLLSIREYVCTQLIQPTVPLQKYYVSFYVSSSFAYTNGFNPGVACNNIGMKLTTHSYSPSNPLIPDNLAQVVNHSIVNDTINWVKISGSFIADSVYDFLCIGNFFVDSLTNYVLIGANSGDAYYYLDDVKLSTDSAFVNSIVETKDNGYINIFPNPARDWIVVEGRNLKSIEVFDLCGRLLIPKMLVSSFKTEVDISSFSSGIFLFKIYTSTGIYINKIFHF